MPEATETQTPPQIKYPVERNGQVINFVVTPILKGGNKGDTFLMFDPATTLQEKIKFLGETESDDILTSKSRIIFQDITKSSTNQAGDFSLDAFKNETGNLSARTESMTSLKEKKDKLTLALTKLTDETQDVTPEFLIEMKKISNQMKALNVAIDNRKRKPKTADEDDD